MIVCFSWHSSKRRSRDVIISDIKPLQWFALTLRVSAFSFLRAGAKSAEIYVFRNTEKYILEIFNLSSYLKIYNYVAICNRDSYILGENCINKEMSHLIFLMIVCFSWRSLKRVPRYRKTYIKNFQFIKLSEKSRHCDF